ncbi:hypothetical protein JA1_004370 [Spathaspora sp. JA1]|nr:hypothetical protein JA1_004370 [Spathaspora sp. JA1]
MYARQRGLIGIHSLVRNIRFYSVDNNKSIIKSALTGFNLFKKIELQEIKEQIGKKGKTEQLTDQLMTAIGTNKEPLYLLSLFHYECKKIGIIPENPEARSISRLKFAFNFLFKLSPIHQTFWEVCRTLDVSHVRHVLYYDVRNLGILDPRNFPRDLYDQLQTGSYNGIDYRNVQLTINAHPKWTEKEEKKRTDINGVYRRRKNI